MFYGRATRRSGGFAGRLVYFSPALEKSLTDAVDASLGSVVVVVEVLHHLLGCTPVGWGERLVPLGEDELVQVRRGVLA